MEEAIFACSNAQTLLHAQVILRVNQAVKRDSRMHSLLLPALGYLDQVDDALGMAHSLLSAEWHRRQYESW